MAMATAEPSSAGLNLKPRIDQSQDGITMQELDRRTGGLAGLAGLAGTTQEQRIEPGTGQEQSWISVKTVCLSCT